MRTAAVLLCALASTVLPCQQMETLPGGARLVTVERSSLPLATIALYFARGTAHEPAPQRGLARFALPLIWLGHGDLGEQEVQNALDAIGGTAYAEVGVEHTSIQISCLATHAARALELLTGALLAPRFEPSIVERERARSLASIQHSLDQPEFLGQQAAVAAVLGTHPYADGLRLTEPERLRSWTRDDVVAGAHRLLAARDAICVLVGPRDPAVTGALRELLGKLPAGDPRPAVEPPQPRVPAPRVLEVPRRQMDQVYIQLAGLGRAAGDPARAATEVVQRIVASGFTSVLVDELRVDHGLVYGVGLTQPFLAQRAPFALITRTRADQVEEVLRRIGAALVRVREGQFPDAALAAARATLRADHAASLQTHAGIAWAIFESVRDHGDPLAWQRHLEALAAVDRDAAASAAALHDPEGITIVLVGDPAALERIEVSSLR